MEWELYVELYWRKIYEKQHADGQTAKDGNPERRKICRGNDHNANRQATGMKKDKVKWHWRWKERRNMQNIAWTAVTIGFMQGIVWIALKIEHAVGVVQWPSWWKPDGTKDEDRRLGTTVSNNWEKKYCTVTSDKRRSGSDEKRSHWGHETIAKTTDNCRPVGSSSSQEPSRIDPVVARTESMLYITDDSKMLECDYQYNITVHLDSVARWHQIKWNLKSKR